MNTIPQYPICHSTEFGDFRNRKKIRCSKCGSLERSRNLWINIDNLKLVELKGRILHIAPEIGIAKKLQEKYGDRYLALDYDPNIYSNAGVNVTKIDLCKDISFFKESSISAIIHVHVLEHLRCNVTLAFQGLNKLIEPSGYHVFGVPIFDGFYKENMDPNLSAESRLKDYGHEDHRRRFGRRDWNIMMKPIFEDFERIDPYSICDEKYLERIGVPTTTLNGLMGHSIHVWKKN